MKLIYDILFIIFGIFYIPFFIVKGKCCRGFGMRFGLFPRLFVEGLRGKKIIWVHGVSVGEVMVSRILIDKMKREFADCKFIVSTTTLTGNALARKYFGEGNVIFFPVDISFVMRRAVRIIAPRLMIIIETEIWPNLITELNKRKVPIVIVNGRISPSALKRYKRVRFFLKKVLSKVSLFCMRNVLDAENIKAIGAPSDKVRVTGNMKFDSYVSLTKEMKYTRESFGLLQDDILLAAASTHSSEEEIILDVYKELVKSYKNVHLLIAPRHIERVPQIEKLIKQRGLGSVCVSELKCKDFGALKRSGSGGEFMGRQKIETETAGILPVSVLILDTLGELAEIYSLAGIVFMGGSLIEHGGHNPIEPALFGKPIISGRNIFNFQDVFDLLAANVGAVYADNKEELIAAFREFLDDKKRREKIGGNAKRVVERNRGAVDMTVGLIKELIHAKIYL